MISLQTTLAFSLLLALSLTSLDLAAQTADGESMEPAATEVEAGANDDPTQDPTKNPTKDASTSAATTTASSKSASKSASKGEDEVFIPSEAISEDFAVSFPVDI